MRFSITAPISFPDSILSALRRGCLFFFLLLFLLPGESQSQQKKPLLRRPEKDYFAGKFVLIPPDSRPEAYQLPRLIAQIADHEVITPPRSFLPDRAHAADVEQLTAWVKSVDYADADGVIVSLDLLTDDRLELVKWIHAQRPGMPIYGFSRAVSSTALEQIASGVLDHLFITGNTSSEAGREEIKNRGLDNRLNLLPAKSEAPLLLTARHLNHRFGISPKVLPVYSSEYGQEPGNDLNAEIKAAGGIRLRSLDEDARRADILLFIQAPKTEDQKFTAFIDALAKAAASGYRVAVADVSTEPADRERLTSELRRRKLLDQLYAYAASDSSSDGITVALAQASARLITAKFLRDDIDRLQRAERAQVEMLLNRWLKAVVYDPVVRPQLDALAREQLKADPENLGPAGDRAEEFARTELRRLGSEVFSEQFRNNVHSVLLSDGGRAEFRLRAIQNSQAGFPTGRISEPEIKARIHLFLENQIQGEGGRAVWEWQAPESAGDRLLNRYATAGWPAFDAGAGAVQATVSITGKSAADSEDYSIRSRRKSKDLRRIEIAAPSERGAFYALARLEQLGVDGKLSQDFQLAESPAFKQRGVIEGSHATPWSHRDRLDMLRFMGRVRMNRYYYAPADDPLCRERWGESYTGNDLTRFQELLRVAHENFIELVYAISPGSSITYSSDQDFAALTRKLDSLGALGVRHFALFFDGAPEALSKPEDRARFQTLAAAQAQLINRAYEHLQRAIPNSTLAVAPSAYTNPDAGRDYLKELSAAIPKGVFLFPTSTNVSSPENTGAQAREWAALADRPLILQDNFPNSDAEPRLLYLGAKRGTMPTPYESGLIASPMNQAHASMLPLVTTAEYAWNPRDYNPEAALARALLIFYDARSRAGLSIWAKAFRDGQPEGGVFKPLFQPQPGEVNAPLIEQRLNEMRQALEAIGSTRERGLLRGEFASFIERAVNALERLKNDPAYEKLPDGKYRKRVAELNPGLKQKLNQERSLHHVIDACRNRAATRRARTHDQT